MIHTETDNEGKNVACNSYVNSYYIAVDPIKCNASYEADLKLGIDFLFQTVIMSP